MSLHGFGRVTPLQMDMLRLAGEDVPRGGHEPPLDADRLIAMRKGRESLIKRTGVDFQYDLAAWEGFLLGSPELSEEYTFEYAWGAVRRRIEERASDPDRARLVLACGIAQG